jgi:hypothetical protein
MRPTQYRKSGPPVFTGAYDIPISRRFASSRFQMPLCSSCGAVAADRGCVQMRDNIMRHLRETGDPDLLTAQLRDAPAVTAELLSEIIRKACRRFPSQGQRHRTARIEQLIATGAWIDAILALIDLELPQWQIRRIAYDQGEWLCALSRAPELPEWLDPSSRTSVPTAPRQASQFYQPICRGNFA